MKPKVSVEAVRKLVRMGQGLVGDIKRGKNPGVDIPLRTLSNVTFDPKKAIIEMGDQSQTRQFFNVAMAKKFMQMLMVAARCKGLIEEKKTTSLRDMFYMCKKTFDDSSENTVDDQKETDEVIEDLEVSLDSLREELHLFADRMGSMAGEITLVNRGDTIDCRRMGSGGWAIPSIVEPDVVRFKSHSARFVLFVEKAAVWERLHEDGFWKKHKCILISGKGQGTRGMRRLMNRMSNELKLPLYVATDNDPWGYYIYSVIKQGSINLAYESMRMTVPQARFLGFSSFDPDRFKLPKGTAIRLNPQDISRAKQILDYPWFKKKPWQDEIKNMLRTGNKYELQALSAKSLSFISEEYLPKKLKDKNWLD